MRRSLRLMCATSPPSGGPTNPMSVRREHGNLYKPNMHSTTLSEHILTQRATRDEEAWRRKKSTEYKENNMPIGMSGGHKQVENVVKKKTDEEFWDMKSEYYAITATALCGFLTGFLLVGKVLQPDAMRLPYDPVLGFLHDVEVHEARATKVMSAVSESMWGRLGNKKDAASTAKKVSWF